LKENQCEICSKAITGGAVIHVAGFPERAHKFCSVLCRDRFLRMEDDELDFRDSKSRYKKKTEDGGNPNDHRQ
jgi:hypothetical protein